MHFIYTGVTTLAAIMTGVAAAMNFGAARSVKATADRLRISRRWMVPFGILLAAGAVGLLLGMAMPMVGAAAATGLIVYFVCAVAAHLRVHDTKVGGALLFLLQAVVALVTDVSRRTL